MTQYLSVGFSYCFVRFGVKDDADKFMVELKEKYKYDAAIAKVS